MKFLLDHDVPDDMAFSLEALGHAIIKLRQAAERDCLLITCNRDDFLAAAGGMPHHGIIILIRRRSRALERAALIRLLDTAGESGLRGNINFA